MAWRRCGKSLFYQSLDEESASFRNAFLDPIDLVLVRTWPRRDGSAGIRRRQLVDFSMESVYEHFMTKTAKMIHLWLERIARDAESGPQNWKAMALADLDVDTVMRDILLDALEVMVDLQIGRVLIDEIQVPGSQGAILKGLAAMGVPRC